MKKPILFVIFAALLPVLAHASNAALNYNGHYELVDNHVNRVFTLDLSQSGSSVHGTFCAADPGDPAAKPTGEGKGRVNGHGVLEFTFKDSFANEGTATLEPAGNGYRFEMRITKFVDPAPLHYYGALTLKKTSDSP